MSVTSCRLPFDGFDLCLVGAPELNRGFVEEERSRLNPKLSAYQLFPPCTENLFNYQLSPIYPIIELQIAQS